MKKNSWLFGFVVCILAFGFLFAGCDSSSDGGGSGGAVTAFDGTWINTGDGSELILNKGNWEYPSGGKGTYKTNDDSITFTKTHLAWGAFQGLLGLTGYFTKAEAKAGILPQLPGIGMTEAELDEILDDLFSDFFGTLSADGNALQTSEYGDFTRK